MTFDPPEQTLRFFGNWRQGGPPQPLGATEAGEGLARRPLRYDDDGPTVAFVRRYVDDSEFPPPSDRTQRIVLPSGFLSQSIRRARRRKRLHAVRAWAFGKLPWAAWIATSVLAAGLSYHAAPLAIDRVDAAIQDLAQ